MFKSVCTFFISISISHSLFAQGTFGPTTKCEDFPFSKPTTGALANINCDFHRFYEKRIQQIITSFGAKNGRPVILNLGGTLIFKHDGKRETASITPPAYHQLKAYSHAAFNIFLILTTSNPGVLTPDLQTKLQALQKNLRQALHELPDLPLSVGEKILCRELASISLSFINQLQKDGNWQHKIVRDYFENVRPLLKKLIYAVSRIELKALDKAIRPWLNQLTPTERNKLGVVLAVSHQARAQEITLQYFHKKFDYRFGEGAIYEQGFVVLEDKFDERSAYALLARHYLDREVAEIILNDANALQSDLLANAARAILALNL